MLTLLKKLTAWLPIAMSLGAVSIVLLHVAIYGLVPQEDEGLAAHLFQLLLVAQVPVVIFFLLTWLRRSPRHALLVLAIQIVAALVAVGAVFWARLA